MYVSIPLGSEAMRHISTQIYYYLRVYICILKRDHPCTIAFKALFNYLKLSIIELKEI